MAEIVLDNDILLKGACYCLLLDIIMAAPSTIEKTGVLGAAKYICRNLLTRRGLEEALAFLDQTIDKFEQLEPTAIETSVAADIELKAQHSGLDLDVGESMLCAIVDLRGISKLLTGDKRAIISIERLLSQRWQERILCLEQLIRRVMAAIDPVAVRDKICAAQEADKALSVCFSCATRTGHASAWTAGLDSYISDLRKKAPTTLSKN